MLKRLFVGLLCLNYCTSLSWADERCQLSNEAVQAMGKVQLVFSSEAQLKFDARHAFTNRTRAAGFQRICEQTIATTVMLFTFQTAIMPQFHMNNVLAPLDIAFIDTQGNIDSIQTMQPYSIIVLDKKLYQPNRPVIAAIEAHAGFFKKHGIDQSMKVTWSALAIPDQ